jgi:hypothetical protein
MRTLDPIQRAAAVAALLVNAAWLPGCDPSQLSDEQRRLVTGTTDFGELILSVDPAEATVTDTVEIGYAVSHTGFKGTLTFALTGLTPEVDLVQDLQPKSERVEGSSKLGGAFTVRALSDRADPLDLWLHLTSVGEAGSRVEHPPARIRLFLRPVRPRLDLDCARTPKAGVAPLGVTFNANGSGCTGHCSFRWEFGDGEWSEERQAKHVYRAPGEYRAVGTLRDEATGFLATCERAVSVGSPGPGGPAQPGPGAEPVAYFSHATTCCPPLLRVDATGSTGAIATYAWDLSWTTEAPDLAGPSPSAAFPVGEGTRGTITLTVTTVDGKTATATRPYPR